ncbi:MAG TPA: TetR/AcrR family transcriptional regulator [Candidatus Krumholzibacteria bacterium]|nr:TetR/AcrR family transcriptional regulator [Candidatus Krumholzibacteria bacterium]HPD71881.1 TetR/AcrR family transcriptional regulator [Candidatus Krumholzibacteria bacterium]HRY41186.1 TetR/AcrR family transcriptional regulator [Candidatus Krumholzibacteria bacterium]
MPPTPRRDREPADLRRDILAAALSLFATNGYHQTTMQLIADRCGFSVGYLYKHFAGKDEMYREMVRDQLAAIAGFTAAARSQGLTPLEELRLVLRENAAHFNRQRDFMRIFHQDLVAEAPEVAAAKRQHFADLVEMLARAQAEGEIAAVDPELLAAAIMGASVALFREMAARPGEHPFDQLPDLVFRLLIDHIRI